MSAGREKLNVYCWKHILDQVPVNRIVLAERVSKEWQAAVLQYMQDIRIRIAGKHHFWWSDVYDYEATRGPDCRILELSEGSTHAESAKLFDIVTRKFGSSVVASYCRSEMTLSSIAENCPNLEHLALIGSECQAMSAEQDALWLNQADNDLHFNKLKQISFRNFDNADNCMGKFLRSNVLEELLFHRNKNMTGRCLTEIQSDNMRSLCITSCEAFDLHHLLSSINRFTTLTEFILSDVSPAIFKIIHLALDAMPYLEVLTLKQYTLDRNVDPVLNTEIAASIGRLGYLKKLDLKCNTTITDQVLEAVASGCKHLKSLAVSACPVTAGAVVDLCRAIGLPLEELHADVPTMTEEHAVNCTRFCPKLEVHWSVLTSSDADARRPYIYMSRVMHGRDHPSRRDRTSDDEDWEWQGEENSDDSESSENIFASENSDEQDEELSNESSN